MGGSSRRRVGCSGDVVHRCLAAEWQTPGSHLYDASAIVHLLRAAMIQHLAELAGPFFLELLYSVAGDGQIRGDQPGHALHSP